MSAAQVNGYRLAPAARRDLQAIWTYTAETWSVDQADRYLALLTGAFERLAENPHLARERTEFTPPVRVHAITSHLVIYLVLADHVLIVRVRHQREDWMSNPVGS